MNVKFKMPKFRHDLTKKGWLKELLMTFLGTTISIVLTFGTAQLIENWQTEQARRMMAMTIISDIDQSIDVIKKRKDAEEKGHEATCYVMENKDRLESIGEDTLRMFINYVTYASFNTDMEFKTMNENIFKSSQDTWRTLNDRKFLDNVQEFYNARVVLEQQSKDWILFKKPFTKEEEYELFWGSPFESIADLCRLLLKNKRLKNYMDMVSSRMIAYLNFLSLTTNLNEENKFLMNITEQEMEEFVNHTYMEIHPAKEKDLMGTWNAVLLDEKSELLYNLQPNHTFTMRQTLRWGTAFFRHKMIQRFSLSGTWGVEGDSLVLHYDMDSYQLEIDDSEVTYPPHLADSVRWFKEQMAGELRKPSLVKKLDQNNRTAHATNIDQSGTRLEQQLIDYFSSFDLMPFEAGLKNDGAFTVSENVADLGGFFLAYDSYVKHLNKQGFKGEQLRLQKHRFYEAYGYLWGGKWTAAEAQRQTLGIGDNHIGKNIHSLARERTNGIVTNTDDWYDLFDVKPGDKLYLAPDERIRIW